MYKVEDKAEVYKVDLINSTCISSQKYVLVYINVTFVKGSIKAGVFIEEVLKAEISNNRLGDLPVSGTQYKVTFTGMYCLITCLQERMKRDSESPIHGPLPMKII